MKKIHLLLALILCIGIAVLTAFKLSPFNNEENVADEMLAAANAFLNTLTAEQRSKVVYTMDNEERLNWHFVPRERKGIAFKEMSEAQKTSAKNTMRSALSKEGYNKASSIIALEEILREVEERPVGDTYRDSQNYAFTIFGTPSNKIPWGWRIEGHHLSINFSSADNKIISGTPTFMGANPAIVPKGEHKGLQILKDEENLARALVKSLDSIQFKKSLINKEAPAEIITGNSRKAILEKFEGLPLSEMNNSQKEQFMTLLNIYMQNHKKEFSDDFMIRIKDKGLNKIYFAWAGGIEKSQPHYYRIHGPNLLIEYDNTQGNANHVHTVLRDLENDFGGDALKKHYTKGHKH